MSLCNDVAITAFLGNELKAVPEASRGALLDLGCGTQPYRHLYEHRFRQIVTGDHTVRSKIDVQLDIHDLPFEDEAFDAVILAEVIEHVSDPLKALLEVQRVLKKNGLLFLTWPLIHPLHELPNDYARYTEFGMNRLLKISGFQLETLTRRGDLIAVGIAMMEQCIFNLLEALSRIPGVGRVLFGWTAPLGREIAVQFWRTYLASVGRSTWFNPRVAGDRLKGPLAHLGLWTMGYCSRGRKIRSEERCASL
jgi:SAM-dependent methyltransferase